MEEEETRVGILNTIPEIFVKLSGGNPDVLSVCMDLFNRGAAIDPDAAMGEIATLLSLDTCHIYEERIWMLYKDVCNEDLVKLIAVLRAWQLGILSVDKLNHGIDNYGKGLDVDNLKQQVVARVPAFGKEEEGREGVK